MPRCTICHKKTTPKYPLPAPPPPPVVAPPTPPPAELPALAITTTTLPGATEGDSYSQTIVATGGVAPRTFALQSGSLPTGLSLSSTGALTGTPSAAGSYSFTVRATDAVPATDDQAYSVTIAAYVAPSVPASVTAAGLGTVYALRTTAGPTSTLNKSPGTTPELLPAGVSLGSVYGYPVVYINASCTFERWDFTGWSLSVQQNGLTVGLTDCRLQAHPDSGLYALYGGGLAGKSGITVTMTRCYLDGATNRSPGQGGQNLFAVAGAVTATYSVFVRASGTTFNHDGPSAASFSYCYFGCFSQKTLSSPDPNLNNHGEVGNISGGNFTLDHCLVDCDDGDTAANALGARTTTTGLFLWQARNNAVVATISNNVLLIRQLDSFYVFQAGDDAHGIDLTFTNNVIQRPTMLGVQNPTAGYINYSGSNIAGSGNLDFDDNTPLPPPINGP